MHKLKQLYFLMAMLAGFTTWAQQNSVMATLDKDTIKIGAQANLTLKATVGSNTKVNFPTGKAFGMVEVLEAYPTDTVQKGTLLELSKKYGITQFDPGKYTIPPLTVVIGKNQVDTKPLTLEVKDVAVDTLKQKMYDIKPVLAGEAPSRWWLWVLIAASVIALGYFGWKWYKKRKPRSKKSVEVIELTPIEKATTHLQELERKSLLQKGAVKEYYSELTDIARTYIEEAIDIPAMESTTGELIEAMQKAVQRKKIRLQQEIFAQLERVLRTADMVKFAKAIPPETTIAEDRQTIAESIVVIEKAIPVDVIDEEDKLAMELREKQLREAKRRKIYTGIGVAAFLLLLVGVFFGGRYIRDNYIGNTTQELLEGEWVKSEYGVPGIVMETPQVLVREDAKKVLPKDAIDKNKETAVFTFGTAKGDFVISAITMLFKQPGDVDLAQAFDTTVKTWEKQGMTNISVKQDPFTVKDGTQGLKATGTMRYPAMGDDEGGRVYYEAIYYKQPNGLQQIIMMYREGDNAGAGIVKRVRESIEFKKLQ
jgi:hypothetical protein